MTFRIAIILIAVVLLATPLLAQECGNVNGTGNGPYGIDIFDLAYLADYLAEGTESANPRMDCDDRIGITLGDITRLASYLFWMYPYDSLDCTPSASYTFTLSPDDTIFVPRVVSIPEGVQSFKAPVYVKFQAAADAVMAPLRAGASTTGFEITSMESPPYPRQFIPISGTWLVDPSLPVVQAVKENDNIDPFVDKTKVLDLIISRQTPWSALDNIVVEAYDIDTWRRVCVARNGDLVIPTVVTFDYVLPPDTLKVSATSLAFHTAAGMPAKDTLTVTFTSSGNPISFDLTAEPWIQLLDLPGGQLTTPATVRVAIPGTALTQGDYTGTITPVNASSPYGVAALLPAVAVNVSVGAPILFPPGDVNCDGILNLLDLSAVIAYLTNALASLPYCY